MNATASAALIDESDGLTLHGRAQRLADVGYSVDDEIHDAVLGLSDEEQFRVLEAFRTDATNKLVLAKARALRIGEINSRLEFAANHELDGLRLESSMPKEVYDFWLSEQVSLGGNPWEDDTFMAEFLRDNPECAIKETSKNIVVTNAFDFRNRKEAA
jgi:hypothetical protein